MLNTIYLPKMTREEGGKTSYFTDVKHNGKKIYTEKRYGS